MAISFISDLENMISIDFEYNQVNYDDHLHLKNYKQYKFGFENEKKGLVPSKKWKKENLNAWSRWAIFRSAAG